MLSPNTRTALGRLGEARVLDPGTAADLIAALDLWQALQNLLRLTIPGHFGKHGPGEIPDSLRGELAAAGHSTGFADLEEKMRAVARSVHRHHIELIDAPAARLGQRRGEGPTNQAAV